MTDSSAFSFKMSGQQMFRIYFYQKNRNTVSVMSSLTHSLNQLFTIIFGDFNCASQLCLKTANTSC